MVVVVVLFGTTAIAYAASGTWYFPGTNTSITGTLYLLDSNHDLGQAKTVNNSNNGVEVLVKVYATKGGVLDPNSWGIDRAYGTAYTTGTSNDPDWWGSIHSTTPTNDPYEYLNIRANSWL